MDWLRPEGWRRRRKGRTGDRHARAGLPVHRRIGRRPRRRDIADYRPFLAATWHDEFDAWAASYVNPFADLLAPTAYRSWDSDRRLAENDADGITAEVLFPNTVPPFFEEGSLVALPSSASRLRPPVGRYPGPQPLARRFCARVRVVGPAWCDLRQPHRRRPGRDRWAAGRSRRSAASSFLPAARVRLPPLWDPAYEPLWTLCEELGVVVNIHGGGGLPDYGDAEVARAIMLVELPWFSHRSVWLLIFGGVLERHPGAAGGADRTGAGLGAPGLETLDWFYGRMTLGRAAEANFFGAAAKGMSMTPSEYFQRNVSVGASFLRASESALRHEVGVARIMWGADYPHSEGSYPFSREALRAAFGRATRWRPPDGRGQRGRSLRVRSHPSGSSAGSIGPTVGRSRHAATRSTSTPPARPATPSTATRCCVPGRGGVASATGTKRSWRKPARPG